MQMNHRFHLDGGSKDLLIKVERLLESSGNARPRADSEIRTTRREGEVYLTQALVVNVRVPIVHIQCGNIRTFQIIREGIEKPTSGCVHCIELMKVNRIDVNHQTIRSHWGKRPHRLGPI